MIFEFGGEAIEWRGPAPYVFVAVPPELSAEIKALSARLTYGWGVIPVRARLGATEYATSLFPKDGAYLVPIKSKVQKAEGVKIGDLVRIRLDLTPSE